MAKLKWYWLQEKQQQLNEINSQKNVFLTFIQTGLFNPVRPMAANAQNHPVPLQYHLRY